MKREEQVSRLLAYQSSTGAFSSTVHLNEYSVQDWNGFTTAQVVRVLRNVQGPACLVEVQERALNFLQRCESPEHPGAFSFWPPQARPLWASNVPEDADDTAVIGLELARHGRLDREALRGIACKVLIPHRLHWIDEPAPPWLRPGVFFTWLRHNDHVNIVDCCVNANVVALLAYADLRHLPGYQEACAMIECGIHWASDKWLHAQSLVPFYAHPAELLYAVQHAIECGAEELKSSYQLLCSLWWTAEPEAESLTGRPLWSSAYGRIVWTSPALQLARQLYYNQV